MYKKTLKRNKGITLIALVVTIIVLLILSGIAIMMLTGQNGILNRASEARDMTGTAQEEEQVKLLAMEVTTQTFNIHDNLTQDILDKAIKNQFGKDGGEGEIISDGYNVTVKKTGNVYQIKDGVVEKVPNKEDLKVDEHPGELEKVGEHTWQINSIEDLVALSYEVGSGQNSYEGETVELGRDLWFTGEFNSYRNEDAIYVEDQYGYKPETESKKGYTTIKQYMIENSGFIGIGQGDNSYKGSFDGKGNALYNAKFSTRTGTCGVFGNIRAEQDIEFKNFTLESGISGIDYAQNYGIIGKLDGNGNIKISYVKNKFKKSTSVIYDGGIIGNVKSSVKLNVNNCHNTTVLDGNSQGGIIGNVEGDNIEIKIENSTNDESEAKKEKGSKTGGMIGTANGKISIDINNCTNNFLVEREMGFLGGMVGYIEGDSQLVVNNCNNNGEITTTLGNVGGIVGSISNTDLKINNCNNFSNITITYRNSPGAGGMIGNSDNASSISINKCINKGKINGYSDAGGIIGYIGSGCTKTEVISCENEPEISGEFARRNCR